LIAHFILNWFIILLTRFQSSLFILHDHAPRFNCPWPSADWLIELRCGKWIVYFMQSLALWGWQPLGSFVEPTLWVACFAINFISLALPGISSIPKQHPLYEDILSFLISLLLWARACL
jgi:hypothetical protein